MIKLKIAQILFWVGFAFWLGETWYFGWNLKPINHAEEICDAIASWIITLSLVIYLSPLFSLYRDWIKYRNR